MLMPEKNSLVGIALMLDGREKPPEIKKKRVRDCENHHFFYYSTLTYVM